MSRARKKEKSGSGSRTVKVIDNPREGVEEGQIVAVVKAEIGEIEGGVESGGGVEAGEKTRNFEADSHDFWKVRIEENRSAAAGTKLRFHSELLGADKIPCSEEEWVACAGVWAWALVGIFFGFKSSLGRMKSFIRTRWGDEGVVSVTQMKPGVFLFNFASQEGMAKVQEQGPWTMDNKPMILQRWTPDETFHLESVEAIPIWVRFSELAPHMRKEPLLSKIASAIGNPIRTDGFTSCGDKLMGREASTTSRRLSTNGGHRDVLTAKDLGIRRIIVLSQE
ncbi:hypothetical protein QQ045_013916 [Rhodiola kirilowii]